MPTPTSPPPAPPPLDQQIQQTKAQLFSNEAGGVKGRALQFCCLSAPLAYYIIRRNTRGMGPSTRAAELRDFLFVLSIFSGVGLFAPRYLFADQQQRSLLQARLAQLNRQKNNDLGYLAHKVKKSSVFGRIRDQ